MSDQELEQLTAEIFRKAAKLIQQKTRTPYGGDVAPIEVGIWQGRMDVMNELVQEAESIEIGLQRQKEEYVALVSGGAK